MGLQSDVWDRGDLASAARHALPASLVRALRWLDGRPDEPIKLDILAAVAGIRPRTLEVHFKTYLSTTPLGWVRRLRLARARRQLLAADEQASVTNIANANGFRELGRFAAQYRRQFHELPSQTLKAARSEPNATEEFADEALRLSWRALASAFMVGPGPCSAALDDAERAKELAPHQRFAKGDRSVVLEPAGGAQFQRHPAAGSGTGVTARRPGGATCPARRAWR